jgi:hypothetical protein
LICHAEMVPLPSAVVGFITSVSVPTV